MIFYFFLAEKIKNQLSTLDKLFCREKMKVMNVAEFF